MNVRTVLVKVYTINIINYNRDTADIHIIILFRAFSLKNYQKIKNLAIEHSSSVYAAIVYQSVQTRFAAYNRCIKDRTIENFSILKSNFFILNMLSSFL